MSEVLSNLHYVFNKEVEEMYLELGISWICWIFVELSLGL